MNPQRTQFTKLTTLASLAPAGPRSLSDQVPVGESDDDLVRAVNEVAEQVRDTLSYIFFDIG